MELAIVIAVVVVALVFDYTNGFHDAANAIATSVSTRALTPRIALLLAAVMNFVGAFLGQKVAHTVSDTITPPSGAHGLTVVMAGLLGAIAWNLITWYYGLPVSSSHALIGGYAGAAIAKAGFGAIIPLPTVLATAVPITKSAAKLQVAAQSTAANGLSTRVPTMVAMELAESWKPFTKSNRKATTTMTTT